MRRSLLAITCLVTCLAGACTGGMVDPSTVEQQEGACIALEDRRFESVRQLECGLTPTGTAMCNWALTFALRDDASSSYTWQYSDVGASGDIECHGATVTEISHGTRTVVGSFDAVTQKLVWQGETYTAVP